MRRVRLGERGTSTIEFSLLFLPMALIVMGGIEMGYYALCRSSLGSAMQQVARLAATGEYSQSQLDGVVINALDPFGITREEIHSRTRAYANFDSNAVKPEPLTKDINVEDVVDIGDCYIDLNRNGTFSTETIGGPEDIVNYEVSASYQLLFGLTGPLFGAENGVVTMVANTTTKNEPYNNTAPELCIDENSDIE